MTFWQFFFDHIGYVLLLIVAVGGVSVRLLNDFYSHRELMRGKDLKLLMKDNVRFQELAKLYAELNNVTPQAADDATIQALRARIETLETIATDADEDLNRRLLALNDRAQD